MDNIYYRPIVRYIDKNTYILYTIYIYYTYYTTTNGYRISLKADFCSRSVKPKGTTGILQN